MACSLHNKAKPPHNPSLLTAKQFLNCNLFCFLLHLLRFQFCFTKKQNFRSMLTQKLLGFSERSVIPQPPNVPTYYFHGYRWGCFPATADISFPASCTSHLTSSFASSRLTFFSISEAFQNVECILVSVDCSLCPFFIVGFPNSLSYSAFLKTITYSVVSIFLSVFRA